MASCITAWAIASSPPQARLLPSTITSFRSSSMPAEQRARPENSGQSAPIAASDSAASATSPSA
jgi:hypothetical protein